MISFIAVKSQREGMRLRLKRKYIFALLAAALAAAVGAAGCGFGGRDVQTALQSEHAAGFAASLEDTTQDGENPAPESFMISKENSFDYQTGMECAAFASAYLLRHYGEQADGMQLFGDFPGKAPDGGVMPYGITDFFEERGYKAAFKTGGTVEELKREISRGAPVIAFIHTHEPYTSIHSTHYVPIVGYDEKYFYFAESIGELANAREQSLPKYNRKTELAKFCRLWENIDGVWDNPYFVVERVE